MNVAADFRRLLVEGAEKNAYSEQQQRDLEQLMYDYDSTLRAMLYSLNAMDRAITLASRERKPSAVSCALVD